MDDIGKLKELELDLADEINCISILKTIQNVNTKKENSNEAGPNNSSKKNLKMVEKDFQNPEMFQILQNNVKMKRSLKCEIFLITKEIFKLDFSIEENSKYFLKLDTKFNQS